MRKERKHYTAEEKVAVLRRRHLLDKVPVSDLCEELSLKPTVFYRWQNLWHDASPNLSLLSSIERENRTLAQVAKERVHPAGNTAFAGRCAASGSRLRRALQPRPLEQCHRLYHAEGYAGRTPIGDSGRPGSEIGSGERTPEELPPAGRVIDETDYFRVADKQEVVAEEATCGLGVLNLF